MIFDITGAGCGTTGELDAELPENIQFLQYSYVFIEFMLDAELPEPQQGKDSFSQQIAFRSNFLDITGAGCGTTGPIGTRGFGNLSLTALEHDFDITGAGCGTTGELDA